MRALCWHGKGDIRCDTVADPVIERGRDVIVKVTSTAICGSDLHSMDGYIPTMEKGDVLGHEFMGEVVDVGRDNKKLKVGDRVIVPFTICCGECEQCLAGNWSVCERSNRNKEMAEKAYGYTTAGLFGYSHMTGGYAGGQAEYVRVPYLTFRMGQTHVKRYLDELLDLIEKGTIDPSFVITHRARLEDGPELYKTFRDKKDGCIKVVMKP